MAGKPFRAESLPGASLAGLKKYAVTDAAWTGLANGLSNSIRAAGGRPLDEN